MTELRTPMHASLGVPRASPEPEFSAGPIREFPKTGASANSPFFIHSSWRTGKTWFSLLFRHFPETICFYEPFNEVLATLTAAEAVQLGPQSWESGHPSSISYWREYIPLIRKSGGIRLFRPEMSYDWFIPVGGLGGELRDAELKYLALLTRYAQRRHQMPVFAFSRSLGRIRPIRERLQGTHIVVIRNLWEQWSSYLYQRQAGNPYFVRSILKMIDNDDPFCQYLCNINLNTKMPGNDGKATGAPDSWERQAEEILTSLSDGEMFSVFSAIHIYLYLNAAPIADLLIDSTRLASDDKYKKLMTARLREMTGLQLSLADAKERFRFTNADPALINRNDIERYVRIATNIITEGDESKELRQLAEQLLDGIYKKGSTNNYLEPARQQFSALRKQSERLQEAIGDRDAAVAQLEVEAADLRVRIGERDAALAAAEARAGAAEASLAGARAELESQRVRLTELERDRDDRVAAMAQLEVEAADLRVRIGERDAALAAAEARAGAAEASLAGARAELESQRVRLTELERDRDDRVAAVAQLEVEAADLRVRIGERDAALAAAEARAGAAEASLAGARAELESQRVRLTELERDRDDRVAAVAQLEVEAADLRVRIGERDAALAAAEARAGAAEASLAGARAELESQRVRLTELERDRDDRVAAVAQLEVEAADLWEWVGEQDAALAAAEARAAAAEVGVTELQVELAAERAQFTELKHERGKRAAALAQLEIEAERLRTRIGERDTALTAAETRAGAAEANSAEAQTELESQRTQLTALECERDTALAAAEARAGAAESLRAALAAQRNDLTAAGQIARELMAASTAVDIVLQKQNQSGSARSMMLGFGRAMRARAIKGGDRARAAEQWPVAARYYRKALARDPVDAAIWVQYGHALKEAGHLSEAEEAYRRSLACEPGVADTHLQLGHVLKLQRRMTAAQAAYLRAFALDPAMPYPREELAGLGWSPAHMSQLGKLSETLGISELRSLREAADSARDQRDWASAARLYGQIVAADPTAHDIAVQLGHAHKEMGEIERAAQVYYTVLEGTPLDDDLHLQIGHLEKMRGDFASATAHYKTAAEINPGNSEARREYETLSTRVRELCPKEQDEAKPGQDCFQGEPADHDTTDELRFLDARAGDIYHQLVAALA